MRPAQHRTPTCAKGVVSVSFHRTVATPCFGEVVKCGYLHNQSSKIVLFICFDMKVTFPDLG
jgi:hypothetical protein